MTEYAERLKRMIENTEEDLAQLRKKKQKYIPALIAETERELAALRGELAKETRYLLYDLGHAKIYY